MNILKDLDRVGKANLVIFRLIIVNKAEKWNNNLEDRCVWDYLCTVFFIV